MCCDDVKRGRNICYAHALASATPEVIGVTHNFFQDNPNGSEQGGQDYGLIPGNISGDLSNGTGMCVQGVRVLCLLSQALVRLWGRCLGWGEQVVTVVPCREPRGPGSCALCSMRTGYPTFDAYNSTSPDVWGKSNTHYCCRHWFQVG